MKISGTNWPRYRDDSIFCISWVHISTIV